MVELHPATLDSIFHALSDTTRRAILRDLSRRSMTVSEAAKPYGVSLAAVSKHLHVLQRANLVDLERRGNFRIVQLKADTMRAAQDWLAYYETFWKDRLDALQNQLETAETLKKEGKEWNRS